MEKILQIQHLMGFGYIEGTSKIAKGNNVLIIPEKEGIVVYKDGLYGVINSSGRTLLPIQLKKIYIETNNGKNNYYMVYGDDNKTANILDILNKTISGTTSTNNTIVENNKNTNNIDSNITTNVVNNNVQSTQNNN